MDTTTLIIVLIVTFAVFLLLRELVCWYFKLNRILEYHVANNLLLSKILGALTPKDHTALLCSKCGTKLNPPKEGSIVYCPSCGHANQVE